MKWLLFLLALPLVGCLSAVPNGPTTAPPAQVSACERYATVRNASVITGLGLTSASAALGTAETQVSSTNVKNDLGWAVAGTAVVVAVFGAVTLIEGQNYTASGCVQILGTLPVAAKPASK